MYLVREFKPQECVQCKVVRQGTIVTDPTDGKVRHYLYVNCPLCGEQIGQVEGYEGWSKAVVPIESPEIKQAVIAAVRRAKAGEPEPTTDDEGDIPKLPENWPL